MTSKTMKKTINRLSKYIGKEIIRTNPTYKGDESYTDSAILLLGFTPDGQPVPSFDEAWGVVQKAISRYGRERPQEAFETMDELTRTIVKNLGWTRLCCSENLTADRANFREAYEARADNLQNSRQLPEFVVKGKAMLQEQYIPAIEEKPVPRIETAERPPDPRAELTQEQMEERARKFEEARRRILSG